MDSEQYIIDQRLINAAKRGEAESVEEYVLDKECPVDVNNAKDGMGETALHWAARNGYEEVIAVLLKFKANPNVLNRDQETPLHKAAFKDHLEAIRVLVNVGKADVSLKNKNGETALQLAKDVECRKLLVPRVDTSVDDEYDEEDSDNDN
ncbi:hypothetical protein CYY_005345 [Polysphondylium violaceum]|uniref:Ankyrin repeat-containing protein n=1 Tax=Polysphondylium violaceum TaxID=133409 RepID=A0A8J4PTN0_9MYCE|nr:hypothetical protein CYY_005345 [Polysphondylium violaceum]